MQYLDWKHVSISLSVQDDANYNILGYLVEKVCYPRFSASSASMCPPVLENVSLTINMRPCQPPGS